MTSKTKKGEKHKRGKCSYTESEDLQSSKCVNMVNTAVQLDKASSANTAAENANSDKITLAELKKMLFDIQINVNNVLRDNVKLREEMVALRSTLQQQQEELTEVKLLVSSLQQELDDARKKIDQQEEEISQLSTIFKTI